MKFALSRNLCYCFFELVAVGTVTLLFKNHYNERLIMSERCVHGMKVGQCGLCRKERERSLLSEKAERNSDLVLSSRLQELQVSMKAGEYVAKMTPYAEKRELHSAEHGVTKFGDYALVSSRKAKDPNFLSHVGSDTISIHIDGHPFLWILKVILAKLTCLKRVRIIPSMHKHMGADHMKLLNDHGIELVTGHHRPDLAWKGCENRSATYKTQRDFMINLSPEQDILFKELLDLEFEEALILARYMCLKNEDYISLTVIGEIYGYGANCAASVVSRKINAVLNYLDPAKFPGSIGSDRTTRNIQKKLLPIRELVKEGEVLKRYLEKMHISALPKGIPASHIPMLVLVHEARLAGHLDSLKVTSPKLHDTLLRRYGLVDGVYRTLQDIGTQEGVSRERIRQREVQAFELLGIKED